MFKPLGWDWKVSSAVIAGFPAREVVVAVMGTLYAVGSDADEASLAAKLKSATWPDGRLIFTLPMVLGLMVFYAWCLQCAATVAIIRRETNTWRWPVFAWTYMTVVAYLGRVAGLPVGYPPGLSENLHLPENISVDVPRVRAIFSKRIRHLAESRPARSNRSYMSNIVTTDSQPVWRRKTLFSASRAPRWRPVPQATRRRRRTRGIQEAPACSRK